MASITLGYTGWENLRRKLWTKKAVRLMLQNKRVRDEDDDGDTGFSIFCCKRITK